MFAGTSSSGSRSATRHRHARAGGFGAAGPRALGVASTGGRRRQNVRTAGFLGIEHKFFDTSLVSSSISGNAGMTSGRRDPLTINCLSSPAQGDKAFNRDGKRIMVESIQIQGEISIPSQSGLSILDVNPTVFIALIQDTQTNGAPLDSEDVFTNPSVNGILVSSPLKNLLSGNRFITHKVWTFNPAVAAAATNDVADVLMMGQNIPFSVFKKLQMLVDFNGGVTADVANVVNNSLHLVAFINDGSWAATINYNARIRFVG